MNSCFKGRKYSFLDVIYCFPCRHRFEGTLSTLFWALFGHVTFTDFETNKNAEITEVTGMLLFAGYSLASVLVALNLLIAMLNNSYQKVAVSLTRRKVNRFDSLTNVPRSKI